MKTILLRIKMCRRQWDNSDVDKNNCGQIDLLTKLKNDILSDILQIYCVAGKVRLYTDKKWGK
jgi:hypothetical protein